MGEIALLGLEFYGRHGVMPEEGRLGARFVVDLWLSVPFEGKGDRLEEGEVVLQELPEAEPRVQDHLGHPCA